MFGPHGMLYMTGELGTSRTEICKICSVSIGTCDANKAKTLTTLSSSSCFRENA
jgi:hypothetical protein